jgi:hypothetical protein
MYVLDTIRTRFENHPLSPVICLEQLESINQTFLKSCTWNSKASTWVNKRLIPGVSTKIVKPVSSHLLQSRDSTNQIIMPIKANTTKTTTVMITREPTVTTPPEIIPYYRLNHCIWSLSDNKEASRWVLPGLHPVNHLETQRGSSECIKSPTKKSPECLTNYPSHPRRAHYYKHSSLTWK